MDDRYKAKVELFKTVATFGFLSAAMFCLGGPLVLAFAPRLGDTFRCTMTMLSGIAGFAIVGCVLLFYCKLAQDLAKPESADAKEDAKTDVPTKPRRPRSRGRSQEEG